MQRLASANESIASSWRRRYVTDLERDDRSSPTTSIRWRVAVINHDGAARQNRSNHFTLNPDSFSVNDPNKSNASRVGLIDVVFDYRANLTGRD